MPNTPTMSSREVCDALNISRSLLTYWMQTGRIAPVQTITGPSRVAQYLFDPADVARIQNGRG